jgi:hypothetical protein
MQSQPRFESNPPSRDSGLPFTDPERERLFLGLVREHLGRNNARVTIAGGIARVASSPLAHGLTNVAQTCNQHPVRMWRRIVAEHFNKTFDPNLTAAAVDLISGGADANLGRLVVRIHPADAFQGTLRDQFVQRVDLEDTITVLAIDIGPSIMPVHRIIAAGWNLADDALFERALGNLARTSQASWTRLSIPPTSDGGIDLLHGDFHAATHILRRPPDLPRVGREGNLIGIPACGTLFSYPLDVALDGLTLHSLMAISLGKSHDGPNAITPHLHWRTPAGDLRIQRAVRRDDGARFLPSPDFVEAMVRLQKAADTRRN